MAMALRGALVIEISDARQRVIAMLESQPLYGSEAVDGTLLTLPPGEKARVRVASVWHVTKDAQADIDREPGGVVHASAALHLFQLCKLVRSVNRIDVVVGPREPPP
jgi:hypothetical protein